VHDPISVAKGNKRSSVRFATYTESVTQINNRDFTKHSRETMMAKFLTLAGKGEQREFSFSG